MTSASGAVLSRFHEHGFPISVYAHVLFRLLHAQLFSSRLPFLPNASFAVDVVASDYLRAFQASDELSERALEITRLVLEFNPSHYTAWWFRRRCRVMLGLVCVEQNTGIMKFFA